MKKNIGKLDKGIRIIIALIIAVLIYTNSVSETIAIILLVVAGISVLTSMINFCPLYPLFGINTCKKEA